MSDFLSLPPAERRLAFGEAAQRLQVSPVMLEKDFIKAPTAQSCCRP